MYESREDLSREGSTEVWRRDKLCSVSIRDSSFPSRLMVQASHTEGDNTMSKLGRKIRRAAAKQKKKLAEKEMAEKIALFDRLPDSCLVCDTPFDKKDKESVQSWCVVIREKEEKVNLYCPECWHRANSLVSTLSKEVNNG